MAIAEKYKKLFEPGTIGKMWLKNRIAMAPMGIFGLVENDGLFGQRAIDYYEERAKGGVGLIITSVTFATTKFDRLWVDERYFPFPRMDSPAAVGPLNRLVERVHDYECKLCLQLTAGFGRVTNPLYVQPGQLVGVSAVRSYWDPSITVKPLTIEEIEELVRSFGVAAKFALSAGVDAVELHAHQGYMMDQFMTSLWNKRNDKYGGPTVRERMTFPLEIIETINDASQGDLPIIFRFALTHKIPGGRTEEEGLEVCQIVEDAGIAALDVDAGCYENLYWPHPPTYQPPACMLDMAAKAKQGVKNIPVMGVGKLNYPDIAVQAVVEGKADFVVIGRGLLADPEWANKTRSGRVEEIRPCIGCHEACLSRLRRKSTSCAVNAACGEERALRLTPAERKKRILVVGAGPAGMEAARVATLRGHKVTLYEKSGALGGKLLLASVPDFKQDLRVLRKYYEQEMERLGVELVLNTEATAEKIIERKPDVVFLASGAVQRIPEVPGRDSPKVTTAIDVLSGKAAVGKDAVIVGGAMTGCELAVHLAQKGNKITIIEEFPRILNDMNHVHANREMLWKMLEENDIAILTNAGIVEVTEAGLKVVNTSFNKSEIATDTVIIAAGLVSHDTLFDALWDKIDEVYRIGGCVTPGKIIDAIWDGYRRARII